MIVCYLVSRTMREVELIRLDCFTEKRERRSLTIRLAIRKFEKNLGIENREEK